MPTLTHKDKDGCYAQWGLSGAKFYYDCNNETSKKEAIKKADAQGKAAYASGYKGSDDVSSIGTFVQELVGKLKKKAIQK